MTSGLAGFGITEVFGDFYLRLSENRLEVTNAERTAAEQREDAQAQAVIETFVDADQFHLVRNMHD